MRWKVGLYESVTLPFKYRKIFKKNNLVLDLSYKYTLKKDLFIGPGVVA